MSEETGIETPLETQEPPPPDPPETAATQDPPPVAEPEQVQGDPIAAIVALRRELQELRPLAKKAGELKAELDASRPFVEFVKANPQLLQPHVQQAPPEPSKADPAVEQYARRFDLYTADGKPDIERAQAIIEENRAMAREEARKVMEPVETQTLEQRAIANLQWMENLTDANGQKLERGAIEAVVGQIMASMPRAQALKTLASPDVVQVLADTALGRQARTKKAPVAPPANPPLHIETAGGGSGPVITDSSRRLARAAGISEKQFEASAKNFKPGQYNSFDE